MRIHNSSLLLNAFILILLAISCTSDPKVETDPLTSIGDEKMATNITEPIPTPAAPSAEEIAAAEEKKIAEEKAEADALKAAKRKEKEEAASKERRRKRREKRKKIAAEKAAAEKLAREAAAATATAVVPPGSSVIESIPTPEKEDLSDIDPELLKVIQGNANGGTPRIRFDTESFDFGRIIQGKEIDHQFEFTNIGSAPLVINNVEATCGCTTPFYPFIPIEPGERGKISVHFNSKGRLGNQTPTITVYTNTDPGTFELQLKGVIDTERQDQ